MPLKCEKVEHYQIECSDFEAFVKEITGHTFEFVADQECGNDSQHSFRAKPEMLDFEVEEWEEFKKTGEGDFMAHTIFNGLCKDGHIEPGEYLISVCW